MGHFSLIIVTIVGASMEPVLHEGSWHIELPTPYAELKLGDIVDYVSPYWHKRIGHPIVGGWSGKWVTKGLANRDVDPGYCTPKNYIGQVFP